VAGVCALLISAAISAAQVREIRPAQGRAADRRGRGVPQAVQAAGEGTRQADRGADRGLPHRARQRETPLLSVVAHELKVSVRQHWTPEADWLSEYQKIQLADLIGTLKGEVYGSAALDRKKSELVDQLATLLSQAPNAAGGFDDPKLAERVNAWMPTDDR